MVIGLLGAFAAAICYGVASVLQALAARQTESADGLDPRLMLRLVRSWRYLLGLGLDGLAFVFSIAALRTLPLFAVQAIVASFLAVTAILGTIFLDLKLRRLDQVGVVAVVIGLIMVGSSAAPESAGHAGPLAHWGVLVATGVLAVVAFPLAKIEGPAGSAVLGAVAGLAFGATSVAARMIASPLSLRGVLTDPASYSLIVAAAVALLTYPTALQRGSVTQATAPLVIMETVAPAVLGLAVLGDHPRPGWGWAAVVGFVLAVAGAIALSRHGELAEAALEESTSNTAGKSTPTTAD